jgi:hypothetical protein
MSGKAKAISGSFIEIRRPGATDYSTERIVRNSAVSILSSPRNSYHKNREGVSHYETSFPSARVPCGILRLQHDTSPPMADLFQCL